MEMWTNIFLMLASIFGILFLSLILALIIFIYKMLRKV